MRFHGLCLDRIAIKIVAKPACGWSPAIAISGYLYGVKI